MRIALALLLIHAACGGGGSDSSVDAAIDARPDAPPPPPNTFRYVISKQLIPATNNQAREYGTDLDGDAVVDNQLGMVLATFAGQGFEVQLESDRAVDRGTILQLVELQADSFTATTLPSSFAMFIGTNPTPPACAGTSDTTCRKHLAGNATFDAAATPRHPALVGSVVGGTFRAGPGKLQLVTIVMGTAPISLELVGARVQLSTFTASDIMTGKLGGAITVTERDTKLYPQLHMNVQMQVAMDCTNPQAADCGCVPSSTGKTMLNLFDTMPKNCTVTLDEIKNNSLIQSLFAPDVTIDGQQALSIGIGITATHAAFTP
ncbi:MAG TPA: hypothetical protein VFO79_16175 [Xanthomonadales bacterium]|nr:hypothetical protein [Xanthomonadales bacterium]